MTTPGAGESAEVKGLESVPLPALSEQPLPRDVERFLRDVEARIRGFRPTGRIAEFEACNGPLVYRALRAVRDAGLAAGSRFCEWGSGFGTATCCAALLGMQARGIEIEPELHAQAVGLAADHHIDAEFFLGSFKPEGLYEDALPESEPAPVGFRPTDADLVFAYPWPAEERWVLSLFARYAAPGTLLLTFHGGVTLRLWRGV